MKDHCAPEVRYQLEDVCALILAGGQARRMGGQDKGLIDFNGRPMVSHVLDLIAPQVGEVILNANRNQTTYSQFGYPVISDQLSDYQGPLAGIVSGLAASSKPLILVLPCDTPLLPDDLPSRLLAALNDGGGEIAVAHDGRRLQPVVALLSSSLLPSLEAYLAQGERKIDRWYEQHNWRAVDFSDCPNAFVNINSLEDKARIESVEDTL